MISKLTGILDSMESNTAVIDVNGVGYLVQASGRTLAALGQPGEAVSMQIETHVREDAISLYGFADADERQWFRLLCTVQGVGAKAALAILSAVMPDQLPVAIASQDKAMLTRADGVGPKLATRIVTELKDKAGEMALGAAAQGAVSSAKGTPTQADAVATQTVKAKNDNSSDAVSALINLGYGRAEAFGAVASVARNVGHDAEVDVLIRESLKELSA